MLWPQWLIQLDFDTSIPVWGTNFGAQKNKKAVKVLFMISSNN